MTPKQIQRFFEALADELDRAGTVYLTGACAAALWGRIRPSEDIDFGLVLRSGGDGDWEPVHEAVSRVSRRLNISASAAVDIDRWGMITLLDYRRTSRRSFRAGKLEVRLLHPANWSIGKLTRYLDADVEDVAVVFRKQKVTARTAARVWGRALRASPPSTTQFRFRRNVEGFFRQNGKAIWGKSFEPEVAITWFHSAARIRNARRR